MPLVFTRDEIQDYLSEMGYGELDDEDMEKFVKDLRKLVKNETKKRRRRRLGHTGNTTDYSTVNDSNSTRDSENVDYSRPSTHRDTADQSSRPRLISTPKSKQKKYKPRRVEDSSEFSTLDTSESNNHKCTPTTTADVSGSGTRTSTKSSSDHDPTSYICRVPLQESNNRLRQTEVDGSRGKVPLPEKTNGQSSGIEFPSVKSHPHTEHPPVAKGRSDVDVPSDEGEGTSTTGTLSDIDLLYLMEHILATGLGVDPSGATSETGTSAKKKLEIPMKIRRDPVALYHWYKTFWDKQKPPGEDRHMQLRWNVRAGTIGRFPCDADGLPVHYLPIIPKQRKKISAF